MNAFKQQCIALRKKDFTLPEIMEITQRSKTSVYFHIKDIPLSTKKLKEISEHTKQRALRNSTARKGVALRPYRSFAEWTADTVLLVAHLMFDGEILKKKSTYNNRSNALIDRVESLMCLVYDFKPNLSVHPVSGVRRIQYNNIELSSFLYLKARELLQNIKTYPNKHQREFIRAFFDDEGCMDYRLKRNLRRVRGYQKDRSILILIQRLLVNFNIESKLQGKNEVVVVGKENLKKFQQEINFSKGVRLNPNRTNSIWKKDIEKRVLLDMAIKSFKT